MLCSAMESTCKIRAMDEFYTISGFNTSSLTSVVSVDIKSYNRILP